MRIRILNIALLIVVVIATCPIFAQNPLTVNGNILYQNGTNSSNLSGPYAPELTDSVTTGSVMKYYIIPDPALNASYTGVLTGALSSSFSWYTNTATGTPQVLLLR